MAKYRITGPDGGTYEVSAPDGASEADVLAYAQKNYAGNAQARTEPPKVTAGRVGADFMGNVGFGSLRGAGSIGATILSAIRNGAAPVASAIPDQFKPDIAKGPMATDAQTRAGMDGGLSELGADTNSLGYKLGKLGGEVAGTAGAGGLIGQTLARLAPAAAPLANAISSAGFQAGGATGAAGGLLRAAGGAISGGASAGLADPSDALAGAVVGGVMAPAASVVGRGLEKAGAAYQRNLAQQVMQHKANAPLRTTIKESIEAGYTVPPSSVNPTFANRVLESISGKQATQQLVSTKNTETTERLVRGALGIADDVPLSQGTLESLRKTAGKTYGEVSELSPQAAADLEALKTARNEAQAWFKAYNRSMRPDDLAKAKEARALSDSLETALEQHAKAAQRPELIPSLREARKQIAKTYTVGRALNDASGTVDARVLGRMYEKGAPLSDDLRTVGRFASAFPTAAKTPQQMGSPDVHNLKSMGAGLLGLGGAAATGPLGLLAGTIPYAAPAAARSILLRRGAQEALIQQAPKAAMGSHLASAMSDPEFLQFLLRTSPVLATQP